MPGEPVPLVADLPEPSPDLLLWPVRVTDQIEELILLPVEEGASLLHPAA
ncbi:hypothetical protein KZ829_01480 [Actinoplanes hulinensis]|uniref:Uncharacterized protein n=1 Tax=Actinoplanes hulinensis TaxID=1144547 RepID=A0ABS7AWF1_9ACTN|nr:hypothetical protein [Actinoplanes hulinensis]MBW6432413.1 hypothetical protein [Actinoplanes hulinensis]